jgi:hypothetical protein
MSLTLPSELLSTLEVDVELVIESLRTLLTPILLGLLLKSIALASRLLSVLGVEDLQSFCCTSKLTTLSDTGIETAELLQYPSSLLDCLSPIVDWKLEPDEEEKLFCMAESGVSPLLVLLFEHWLELMSSVFCWFTPSLFPPFTTGALFNSAVALFGFAEWLVSLQDFSLSSFARTFAVLTMYGFGLRGGLNEGLLAEFWSPLTELLQFMAPLQVEGTLEDFDTAAELSLAFEPRYTVLVGVSSSALLLEDLKYSFIWSIVLDNWCSNFKELGRRSWLFVLVLLVSSSPLFTTTVLFGICSCPGKSCCFFWDIFLFPAAVFSLGCKLLAS